MSRTAKWLWPALAILIAGCGIVKPVVPAGQAASITLTLHTVPVVRSVNISPGTATFGNCTGGDRRQDTPSTAGQLGYPNGVCWIGLPSPPLASFPIKITNTGMAAYIEVNGESANPSDGGNQWSLCNVGRHAEVECTGDHGAPGIDQYLVQNFGINRLNKSGLTDIPACDHELLASGNCLVPHETKPQVEGIELTGPTTTTDTVATNWTVTITWTPVPGLN